MEELCKLLDYNRFFLNLPRERPYLPMCYHTAFYPYFYSFLFAIVQHTFSPTYFSWGVEHSWAYYIYSMPMRYDNSEPFAISEFISGLTSQSSPILLDNLLEDSSSRRQNSKNFSYFLSKYMVAFSYKYLAIILDGISENFNSNAWLV